jgi:predicted amidohydrolase
VLAGSIPEDPGPDGGPHRRLFNTSCLIGPTGSIEAVYRKIHLFDVTLDGAGFRESATIAPGEELCVTPLGPTASHPGGRSPVLGLSLCYDLRFPEMYRIMTLLGATVVAVPAAFTARTGPSHWELLLRARAAENQVFVIAAGQVGDLPAGMPACHGHSMIVDPWGTIIAEQVDDNPGVIVADLDLDDQQRIRSELPVLANRRPGAYRWPDEQPRGTVQHGR